MNDLIKRIEKLEEDNERLRESKRKIQELAHPEKHEHVFKGDYGKDDLKQLHAYCGDCGKEMDWPQNEPIKNLLFASHPPIERDWEKTIREWVSLYNNFIQQAGRPDSEKHKAELSPENFIHNLVALISRLLSAERQRVRGIVEAHTKSKLCKSGEMCVQSILEDIQALDTKV